MKEFILLENRNSDLSEKNSFFFSDSSEEVICTEPEKIVACLERIDTLRELGHYLVGFISYEASYFLEPDIIKNYSYKKDFPLLHFLAFKKTQRLTQIEVNEILEKLAEKDIQESFAYNIKLNIDITGYQQKFNDIKQHLYEGNTYQVNYTDKYKFDFQGSPINFYQALRERQKVEYSGLLYFKNYQILSLSPELFFSKTDDHITVKPMKGTMPRGLTANEDNKNKETLKTNQKLVSENVMIVDLLRNDLSAISHPGSVKASNLLHVDTYETVHQMISTVDGKVDTNTSFKQIISSLFPCGSVTGVPKRRTIQIINDLEQEPRNIYTGAIGYITPQNDMCFNVAIRTLLIQDKQGELGVGGGITYDSSVIDEFEEVKLKAKFFTQLDPGFKLIESIKYTTDDGLYLLDEHLQRLKNSSHILNFVYDETKIKQALQEYNAIFSSNLIYKIRLILDKNGLFNITHSAIDKNSAYKNLLIKLYENEYIDSSNILLQHKTIDSSIRNFYNDVYSQYRAKYFDVIFMNKDSYITEGTISNIFIKIKDKILTPATDCGLLPGIMRQKILTENPSIEECYLRPEDLYNAETIWMANSVRGMMEVALCKKKG